MPKITKEVRIESIKKYIKNYDYSIITTDKRN